MRLLKILFIILLLIFPFGELLRFDLGNNIRFKPLDVLAGSITIYWFILYITKKAKRPTSIWYMVLFPAVAILSLTVNTTWLNPNELLASSLYLFRWISYAGVFLAIVTFDDGFKKKILSLLLLDGLLIVLLGFFQYFFFSSLKPLYYLGWDDHMYRMFSVFLDPNYTGGFFVVFLLFTMGMIYTYLNKSHAKKSQDKSEKLLGISLKNHHIIIILSIISGLTLIACLLTFSRSSLLMLAAGTSMFFILIGRKKLILLLFAVLLIFTLLISSKFYVENINLFRQASSNARIGNYQSAISIIANSPILGVGFNAYRYAKENNQIQMGWTKAPSHADAGVDNSFLFVLATTGIVGLAAYLLLWGYMLKRAFWYYKTQANVFALIFMASAAGLFVHSLFLNSLFFPAIMLWMWILNGLMEQRLH